jgi:hypothetical protein
MLKWSCGGIQAQIGGVESPVISGTLATTLDSEADLSRFTITSRNLYIYVYNLQ